MNLIDDVFSMENLAILIFWSLILALLLWLIYTIINNNFISKNSYRINKSKIINKFNYKREEKIQKEDSKKSKH